MVKKTIEHFTHPEHQLSEFDAGTQYNCDGCKNPGSGKRYRCHGCDFDLHNYCGTGPNILSSFMHPHKLTLMMRKAQIHRQNNRVCDVCRDNVEGLFYRCKDCDFDVHPMCTQLPEALRHVLHEAHPLRLESPSSTNLCAVCGCGCSSWRYRCGKCGFDIHLECVLVKCEKPKQRKVNPHFVPPPTHYPSYYQQYHPPPPPHFAYPPPPHAGYPYGYPYAQHPPYNMHQNNLVPQPQQVGGAKPEGLGKKMFGLVGQLGMGVMSNMIFGMDITSFF